MVAVAAMVVTGVMATVAAVMDGMDSNNPLRIAATLKVTSDMSGRTLASVLGRGLDVIMLGAIGIVHSAVTAVAAIASMVMAVGLMPLLSYP